MTLSRPSPRPQGPCEQRFKDAVAAEVAMGVPRDLATSRIISSQPELHRAMIAEATENRRSGPRRQQAAHRPQPQAGRATIAWQRAIQQRVDAGTPRARAIRDTVLAEPALHQQMLAEANKR